ncbi:hypothetical protein D3C76_1431980 [compost metagenome]
MHTQNTSGSDKINHIEGTERPRKSLQTFKTKSNRKHDQREPELDQKGEHKIKLRYKHHDHV